MERFRRQFMNELEERVREQPVLDRALSWVVQRFKQMRYNMNTTKSGRIMAVMLPFVGMILLGASVVGLIEGWTPLGVFWHNLCCTAFVISLYSSMHLFSFSPSSEHILVYSHSYHCRIRRLHPNKKFIRLVLHSLLYPLVTLLLIVLPHTRGKKLHSIAFYPRVSFGKTNEGQGPTQTR